MATGFRCAARPFHHSRALVRTALHHRTDRINCPVSGRYCFLLEQQDFPGFPIVSEAIFVRRCFGFREELIEVAGLRIIQSERLPS